MNIKYIAMQSNDADAATIGEYLSKLLELVWIEDEGFDGKRPFGNSGWKQEVYNALGRAEAVAGEEVEPGYWEIDESLADAYILATIKSLSA